MLSEVGHVVDPPDKYLTWNFGELRFGQRPKGLAYGRTLWGLWKKERGYGQLELFSKLLKLRIRWEDIAFLNLRRL